MTATATHLVSLEEVLAYRHAGIVRRYAKEQHVSLEDAQEVFQETLKWLYLCYRGSIDTPEGFGCTMTPEIEKIDEMWHTFVLFTRDYADFCEHYFGFFLHHVPNEDEGDETPVDAEAVQARLEQQFGLVYDVLGEDTLTAWYEEGRYAGEVAE